MRLSSTYGLAHGDEKQIQELFDGLNGTQLDALRQLGQFQEIYMKDLGEFLRQVFTDILNDTETSGEQKRVDLRLSAVDVAIRAVTKFSLVRMQILAGQPWDQPTMETTRIISMDDPYDDDGD